LKRANTTKTKVAIVIVDVNSTAALPRWWRLSDNSAFYSNHIMQGSSLATTLKKIWAKKFWEFCC